MTVLDPQLCTCGHYRYIHTSGGCPGWLHSDYYPWWLRALRRLRIHVLLRCNCWQRWPEDRSASGLPVDGETT